MAKRILVQPGDVFGALTVLQVHQAFYESAKCTCKCSCGSVVVKWKHNLTSGHTLSCGCLQKRRASEAKLIHGHTVGSTKGHTKMSPTYKSWASMCGRVRGDVGTSDCYAYVDMDPRWLDFEVFLADVGERPSLDYTLDRIDNDKGYWPENVRWLTKAEQAKNRRPWKHTATGLARISAANRNRNPVSK